MSDTGIGMNEEQLGRLFQAFTQADTSTTRHYGGTGLGLTITRHFANMLGGTIQVTSKAGEGSSFIMVLPDHPVQAPAPTADTMSVAAASGNGSGLTVLVVDDDPTVHDLLAATLAKEGHRVLHARDGAEALDILRKTPPDIVTLDVMMPKVDGWSVLGVMKSDPALRSHPGHHDHHRRRPQSRLLARRVRVHDQADRPLAAALAGAALRRPRARKPGC